MADVRRVIGAAVVAVMAASLPACLSPVPLDPKPQADLDPRLVGAWRCLPPQASADDEPANLTIAPGHDRVYPVEFGEAGKEADRYEAHVTMVGKRAVVNVRDVSGGDEPWDFLDYEFVRPNILLIRIAGEDAFEGVAMTPAALRERMGRPGAFTDFAVCVPQKKD